MFTIRRSKVRDITSANLTAGLKNRVERKMKDMSNYSNIVLFI